MEKIEFRGTWVRGDFYNAADVDALLSDVRALVEADEMLLAPVPLEYVSFNNRISDIELTRKRVEALKQAVAAVERNFTREGGDPSEEKNNRLG